MKIVIDANIGIHTVLETPFSDLVAAAWNLWRQEKAEIFAPALWLNEVTSVIHRTYSMGEISEDAALEALDTAFALDLEWVPETPEICKGAFNWASKLGQFAAYDGFYLALAEKLGVEFWTLDGRLANRSKQIGVDWVHLASGTSP